MTGRAPDDLRDSLAIAARAGRTARLQIGAAPEEALWMLGAPQLARVARRRSPHGAESTSGGAARHRLLRLALRAGDHLVIDGGPHGYQNGGHAHADALSLTLTRRRRAAADRSRHRLLHRPTRAARPHAVVGAAQHADPRRPIAVAAARAVSLVARRHARVTSLADERRLRLLRRRRTTATRRSSIAATCSRCTAIWSSSPTWSSGTRHARRGGALAPRPALDRRRARGRGASR